MKEYKLKINGNNYHVAIKDFEGHVANIEVNGTPYKVEMETAVAPVKTPKIIQVAPISAGDSHAVKTVSSSLVGAVKSPLPGVILDVFVRLGEEVKAGQKLLMLEAMKMENSIEADRAGKVTAIKVNKGDSVLEGAELVVIE